MNTSIKFVSFPALENCSEDGLLAMGGDLNVDTLVSAYSQGIFPWFNKDQPLLWWSPDPRMVLYPNEIKISRSLAKTMRRNELEVTYNTSFVEVINACALRGEQRPQVPSADTWITADMEAAYTDLHRQGFAHSVEVWLDHELVGGLYGVALGKVFFGESMFSRVSDASKVALVTLCELLAKHGFKVIDCQVASDHLFSLGAKEIPRTEFMKQLESIDINQKFEIFHDQIVKKSR